MEIIPLPTDNAVKLEFATTIPDRAPPAAPAKATKTSTIPYIFARFDGVVASITKAVPLINPKFHPNPSKINAIVR